MTLTGFATAWLVQNAFAFSIRGVAAHPVGAAVALLWRCLALAVLGSNGGSIQILRVHHTKNPQPGSGGFVLLWRGVQLWSGLILNALR